MLRAGACGGARDGAEVVAPANEPDEVEDGHNAGRLEGRADLQQGDVAAEVVDCLDGPAELAEGPTC